MNNLKSKAGFTLVELIVVIAILAILAGVAVPAYTGYIAKAKEASDIQVLASVNTAAQGLAAADSAKVTKIEVTSAGGVTVTTDPTGKVEGSEVTKLTGTLAFKSGFSKATWENGSWTLTPGT